MMTTITTTNILTCPTTIQGVVGSSCDGSIYFSWLHFVCSHHLTLRETFKAKVWERVC